MEAQPMLELRGLRKSFGGLRVIDDLDLSVMPGEIVSVIGPNGAGKTTLFNVLTGIYKPDAGDILAGDDGQELTWNAVTVPVAGRFWLELRARAPFTPGSYTAIVTEALETGFPPASVTSTVTAGMIAALAAVLEGC